MADISNELAKDIDASLGSYPYYQATFVKGTRPSGEINITVRGDNRDEVCRDLIYMKEKLESQVSLRESGFSRPKSPDSAPKCPICKGDMELRSGKYGDFWGCVKYPECRGIVKLGKERKAPF